MKERARGGEDICFYLKEEGAQSTKQVLEDVMEKLSLVSHDQRMKVKLMTTNMKSKRIQLW